MQVRDTYIPAKLQPILTIATTTAFLRGGPGVDVCTQENSTPKPIYICQSSALKVRYAEAVRTWYIRKVDMYRGAVVLVVREIMNPMMAIIGPMMVCFQRSAVLSACQELIIDTIAAKAALKGQQESLRRTHGGAVRSKETMWPYPRAGRRISAPPPTAASFDSLAMI